MFPPPLCFLINLLLCFLISSSFTSFPVSSPSSSSLVVVFLSSLLSIPVYFLSSPSFLPSFLPCFPLPLLPSFHLTFFLLAFLLSFPLLFSHIYFVFYLFFLPSLLISSLKPVLFLVVVFLSSYLAFSFLPSLPLFPVLLMFSFRSTDGCNSCIKNDSFLLSVKSQIMKLCLCVRETDDSRIEGSRMRIWVYRRRNNSGWLRPLSYILLTDRLT